MKNLGDIYLGQNQFSGSLPYCLGNITSLREIYLSYNKLSSNIPQSLGNLHDLVVLDLSSNNMVSSLPPEVGNLKAVTKMDLSMNQFSNRIPREIGGLQNLAHLSLRHNKLKGSIPDSMSYMVGLEFLDLSHNNISGSIPKSLEKLQNLKYFNISVDKLYGEIPSGGPFKNLSSQFFIYNGALYGSSRFSVPPCSTSSKHRSNRKKILVLFLLLAIAVVFVPMTFVLLWIRYRRGKSVPQEADLLSTVARERISFYEFLRATNALSESNLIGSGSFGSVYEGILRSGTAIAVKVFNLHSRIFDKGCEVLCILHHRNLVKVITSCSNLDFKALVLEYMPNGSLEKYLYSHNYFLDIRQRLSIMIAVACALEHLHHGCSSVVIHCDLKPSNVLLNEDMVVNLSDFGISKLLGDDEIDLFTETLATLGYIAPDTLVAPDDSSHSPSSPAPFMPSAHTVTPPITIYNEGISQLKQYLFSHIQTKDLGKSKYFSGIEVAQSKTSIAISQRKYALDILEKSCVLNFKPIDTHMDPNIKLVPGQGEPLKDPSRYRRLVGKLNYLTITRPDISFAVSVVSQFLQDPCKDYWDAVIHILRHIKKAVGQGLLYEDKGQTDIVGYSDVDGAGSPIII
ncbi:putative acid phosphatase 1-like [Capsicum annuum]|nr:putative acid phosphatase 1-like [Capsicum annuum]